MPHERGAIVEDHILINLFSKWFLLVYGDIRVCEEFLIKLYFKAT